MNKSIPMTVLFVVALSVCAFAQKGEVTKYGEKEARVEVINDIKVLTVTTFNGNQASEMRYTGAAAEQKLAELEVEATDVKMEDVNGQKTFTVTTNKNDNVTVEVFEGKAAEDKLKELESAKASLGRTIKIKDKHNNLEKSHF